jgi:hypothetical protein
VYEYRPDTPLAQPLGGGAIHPSTFEPRPAEFVPTHRGGSYCTADGRAASYAEVDNWLSFHYFSEGGRRFLVRIVTITDPGGKQQEIATRILNTLTVTPLTTGITQPPPPPTTLDDAAVRAQLADVHVFETGECANPPDGTIVSCSEPHMIEYFATYSYPGVAFFGPLAEGCGQLFEEYTGHERNAQDLGYSWGSELLNPETVANGTVDVRCVITSISGTPPQVISMTGSALHTNG